MNDDAKPTKSSTDKSSLDSKGAPVQSNSLPRSVSGSFGVAVLFAVLITWCLLIAIGSFQTQASTDYRRPLIVILTMGTFLGIWALALRSKRSATQRTR